MNRLLTGLLAIFLLFPVFGQVKKHKKKNSTAAGTLFFYWGYNHSGYTKSDIRFVGANYDFTLKGVSAVDRQDPFDGKVYLNPTTITVPQFNGRIGYYFKDKWAISFGNDHYKYVMQNNNKVLLDGFIAQGVDANWSGNYNDEPVTTNSDNFHYENTNGLNFLRVELMRSFNIWEAGSAKQFALTGNLGAGIGPMLTYNDFNFAGQHTYTTPSISGYGIGLNASMRMEFFRHFFFQLETGTGFVHLMHVRTRPDDRNQYAKQRFGFVSGFAAIGGIFYLRPKNGCDSCPHW
jgi:hypothetical protein